MPVMQKKLKLSRPLTPIITSSFWKCIPTIPFPSWPLTRQVKVLVPIRYPSKLSREFPDRQLIWNLAKSQWILSRSAGILQSSQMAKFLATSWLTKQRSKTKVSCVLAFIVHCVTQKKGETNPKKWLTIFKKNFIRDIGKIISIVATNGWLDICYIVVKGNFIYALKMHQIYFIVS